MMWHRLWIWKHKKYSSFSSALSRDNISFHLRVLIITCSHYVCVCVILALLRQVCLCMWHYRSSVIAWDRFSKCFFLPKGLFGLALIQIRMCRLITQPGDQWAYPGIVPLSVLDGVSLQAPSCGQKGILSLLSEPGKGSGLKRKPMKVGLGSVFAIKLSFQ